MLIVVDPVDLAIFSPQQLQGVLAHELDHLTRMTPEIIALQHNDLSLIMPEEKLADKEGTGPRGTCRPDVLAQALEVSTALNMKQSGMPAGAYYAIMEAVDTIHPPILGRIADLNSPEARSPGCAGRK